MDIVKQLLDIYYKYEYWHKNKMPYDVAYSYHKTLLENGNIIVHIKDGKVLGYVEFWKITPEQIQKVINENFNADTENIKDGEVCYVANCWIQPEYRNNGVYKILKKKLFDANDSPYYVGQKAKFNKQLKIHRRN